MSRLDPATDATAALAARLLHRGEADSIAEAIEAAARRAPRAPLPSGNLVRRHLRGIAEEALGAEGYQRWRGQVLAVAAQAMRVLDDLLGISLVQLCGRAARGLVDGDPRLDLRAYSKAKIGAIAAALVEAGFEEPQIDTLASRHGRLDRLRLDHEGIELSLVRCPPGQVPMDDRDLVTGERLAVLDAAALQERIDRLAEGKEAF
jgi:hypothetical protein